MEKTKNELTVLDLNLITKKEYIDIIKSLEKQLKKWVALCNKIARKRELINNASNTQYETEKDSVVQEPEVIFINIDYNSVICEFGYTFSTTAKDIEYGGLNTWEVAIKYRDCDEWIKIFEYQDGVEIDCTSFGHFNPIAARNEGNPTEKMYDNMIVYKKLDSEEINEICLIIQDNLEVTNLFEKYLTSNGNSYNKTKFL
mgnify:CR=1 FL=1